MKKLMILGLIVMCTSCSKMEVDPVGEPFIIELKVEPTVAVPQSVNLNALVAFGGFGSVKATVTFLNGKEIIGVVSDSVPYTGNDPQKGEVFDQKFQKMVNLQPNTDYNLSARVNWSLSGTEKSLTSAVVKYSLP